MSATDAHQQVIDKLNELGETTEKVAETLEKLGVYGYPGHPSECAIAYYLHYSGFDCLVDEGGSEFIEICHYDEPNPWVPIPEHILEFSRAFDAGEYPELERS